VLHWRLILKMTTAVSLALFCVTLACTAQEGGTARAMSFKDIFASRQNDTSTYVLLGAGWLRTIRFGDPGQFVSTWLTAHPNAVITPISRMFATNTRTRETRHIVYIWVEDEGASLNVDMVRAGMFPGGVMTDMVDNLQGLNELLERPELATTKTLIEKQREQAPQDRSERLLTDEDYHLRMRRVEAAETEARQAKVGIWSDAMKAEREEEGYP